jgi:hypothetical protein
MTSTKWHIFKRSINTAFQDAIQNFAGFVASSEVGFGSLKLMNDMKKHEA